MQLLAGGNVFVGFGAQPFFSEFSPPAALLFDASLPAGRRQLPRVLRSPGSARRGPGPVAAARRTGPANVSVYASWNGATDVAPLAGAGGAAPAARLKPVAIGRRKPGFETRIDVTGIRDDVRRPRARRARTRAGHLGGGHGPMSQASRPATCCAPRAAAPRGRAVAHRLARRRLGAAGRRQAGPPRASGAVFRLRRSVQRSGRDRAGRAHRAAARCAARACCRWCARGIAGDPAVGLKRRYAIDGRAAAAAPQRASRWRASEPLDPRSRGVPRRMGGATRAGRPR